jgi:LysR family transcriptional regulator, flagellar master operon regulator
MFMIDHEDENVGTLPAACQVDPAVNSFFSKSTQSVHPAKARWYSDDTPTAPPPMITTRAVVGKSLILPLSFAAQYRRSGCGFQFGHSRSIDRITRSGAAMQIDHLETFLDLVETRSFNRTAERLGVTQSTVSARISALEAELGARLFNRSRAGTDLTTEGLRFDAHARGLRRDWVTALRALRAPANEALAVKLGIQNDLAAEYLGDWIAAIRTALPQTAFYIEPDYSTQMCADLITGQQDFAILFSPKTHPDLHFASLGEVRYRMIAARPATVAELEPETYISAHFSPAFAALHRGLFPGLSDAPLSVGQSHAVVSLITAMGGAGYVLEPTARRMIAAGTAHPVADAPILDQPVYAAMHLKNRTAPLQRRLLQIVQSRLASR